MLIALTLVSPVFCLYALIAGGLWITRKLRIGWGRYVLRGGGYVLDPAAGARAIARREVSRTDGEWLSGGMRGPSPEMTIAPATLN